MAGLMCFISSDEHSKEIYNEGDEQQSKEYDIGIKNQSEFNSIWIYN